MERDAVRMAFVILDTSTKVTENGTGSENIHSHQSSLFFGREKSVDSSNQFFWLENLGCVNICEFLTHPAVAPQHFKAE